MGNLYQQGLFYEIAVALKLLKLALRDAGSQDWTNGVVHRPRDQHFAFLLAAAGKPPAAQGIVSSSVGLPGGNANAGGSTGLNLLA